MLDALLKGGHHVTVALFGLVEGHEVEMKTLSVEAWKKKARAGLKVSNSWLRCEVAFAN
jgi:hypothetical protein